MNGLEVNYPCSPVCALFGDCVTAFESQKKANVRTNADRILGLKSAGILMQGTPREVFAGGGELLSATCDFDIIPPKMVNVNTYFINIIEAAMRY